MTKPNPLCNLSGGRVLIKRNSKEIWREVVLKPRPMVVYVLIYGSIHNVTVRIGVIWGGLDGRTSAATVPQYQNKVRQQTTQPHYSATTKEHL